MQVFYANPEEISNRLLSKEESHHCIKVLRKKQGEQIHLLDGVGNFYFAEITDDHPKNCAFQIIEKHAKTKTHPNLHIAFAPPKSWDRTMIFIEKIAELGIDEISLIITDHSERRKINEEKVHKQLIGACKQSLAYHFPKLNPVLQFKDFVADLDHNTNILLGHCDTEFPRKALKEINIDKNKNHTVFIGPEGDFSKKEIEILYQKNALGFDLGSKRLRSETAAIVLAMYFNYSL